MKHMIICVVLVLQDQYNWICEYFPNKKILVEAGNNEIK